jgi:hypothetical protein
MPRGNTVLCAHCGEYLPRKREREHRRLAFVTIAPPPWPAGHSRLRRIVDIDTDTDDGEPLHGADDPEDIDVPTNGTADERTENEDIMMQDPDPDGDYDVFEAGGVAGDDADEDTVSGATGAALRHRWGTVAGSWHENDSESDADEENNPPYPRLEDSDEECDNGFIDWKAIEEGYGLSAWDQLGESYEAEAAAIGVFSAITTNNVI